MSEAEKKFRADASALGEKISNETMAGVQKDIQKNSAIDLNKNQEYRNIVNGLQPKEVAVNDRGGIDVDAANARRAQYASPERGEVNSILIGNLGNQYFAENPLYDMSFLDFELDPSLGSNGTGGGSTASEYNYPLFSSARQKDLLGLGFGIAGTLGSLAKAYTPDNLKFNLEGRALNSHFELNSIYGNNFDISTGNSKTALATLDLGGAGSFINEIGSYAGRGLAGFDLFVERDKYQGDLEYGDFLLKSPEGLESRKVIGKLAVDEVMGRALTNPYTFPVAGAYFVADFANTLMGTNWTEQGQRLDRNYDQLRAMGMSHSQANPFSKF